MRVIETLEQMGNRLQVALIVGSVPVDGSGDIQIIYGNGPAAAMFGFPSAMSMEGMDVRSLMPKDIAVDHRRFVGRYVDQANGGSVRQSSIMGNWRSLDAVRKDGSTVPVQANVADIRNSEERYFVAIFRDRTEEVKREQELEEASAKMKAALEEAQEARRDAEDAKKQAEESLYKQKRLSGQISLLRQIYGGTIGLVVLLGVLVVASWITGTTDKDALSMIERVLLVLTGILGSAMASVFDSKARES